MARKTISRSPARTARAVTLATKSPEDQRAENIFLGVMLILLVLIVFIPAYNAGFIWDDDQLLTANPQVHSPDGWWTLWLKPQTADYFPLTSTTLWIEWRLWGMDPSGYHVTNVLLHALVVLLTWRTLVALRIPGAWVAAAIFAVHPVCVESVAWISERKNTISQIFFLLSILNYVKFQQQGRTRQYGWAVACFLLSLLAKTSVVMLPFILLLLAWWRKSELEPLRESYELEKNPVERGILLWSCVAAGILAVWGCVAAAITVGESAILRSWPLGAVGTLAGAGLGYGVGRQLRRVKQWNSFNGFEIIRSIPFFLSALLLGAVTVYFQYGRAIGGEEIPIGNLWQRTASACFAAGFYLYSALWPFNIIEIYPQWHRAFSLLVTQPKMHLDPAAPEAIPYWVQILPGLVIGGLLAWCWLRRTKAWARALLVGLGTYFLAMLPALGFLTMSYMRLTLVADHFQYISIVAVVALVVAAGNTGNLKPIWLGLAALFFAVVSYFNWGQTQDNQVYEVLWILGAIVLALAVASEEMWKYVWGGFLAAVLFCFSIVTFGQTEIYHSEKTLWTATLDKNPYSWQAHNHLGAALYMEGNWRAAAPHFRKATELKPENPESHNNLGLALMQYGLMDQAIQEYETAVRIKDDSAMRTNLANAYSATKQYEKAIENYQHAIRLSPDNASSHCNLGYVYMTLGRVDDAIPEFEKALEIDPRMPQARKDLEAALRAKGISPPPAVQGF